MIPENFSEIVTEEHLSLKAAAIRFGVNPSELKRMSKHGLVRFGKLKSERVLAAIVSGINTSSELAAHFKTTRNAMGVRLYWLAERNIVIRDGFIMKPKGRPLRRWRVVEAL